MPATGKLARKAYGKTAKNTEGSMSVKRSVSFLLNASVILFSPRRDCLAKKEFI
jgi:hypothetical protein